MAAKIAPPRATVKAQEALVGIRHSAFGFRNNHGLPFRMPKAESRKPA